MVDLERGMNFGNSPSGMLAATFKNVSISVSVKGVDNDAGCDRATGVTSFDCDCESLQPEISPLSANSVRATSRVLDSSWYNRTSNIASSMNEQSL